MSLLKKLIAEAQALAVQPRETYHGKLMGYAGSKDVMVNGVAKAMITVDLLIDGALVRKRMFKDSAHGLPNYVPAAGVDCAATFSETEVDGTTYLNLISLGIK